MSSKRWLASVAGVISGAGIVTPLFAQDAMPTDMAASDIIVTARRIEERLQDVPISITVFNQQQLARANISSGSDLATVTPSLYAQKRYGADNATFAIRGFTQEQRTTASVGVYFADVVAPRSSTLAASGDGAGPGLMFDLQNIQVLKGPQGTLFGRNTTGGMIVIVPRRPTDSFEGYVEGTVGNYEQRRLQSVINIPISKTLRIRTGVDWQQREGYLRNVSGVGPDNFGDVDYVAARFSMLWDITPNLESYAIATYSNSTPNGIVPRITDCTTTASAVRNCEQVAREKPLGRYVVGNSLPWARQDMKVWQVSHTLKWVASDNVTVKNISSYGESVLDMAAAINGVWNPITPLTTDARGVKVPVSSAWVGMGYGSSTVQAIPDGKSGHQWTFTNELQANGVGMGGSLQWQGGAYVERSGPRGLSGTQNYNDLLCHNEEQMKAAVCTDVAGALGGIPSASSPTGFVGYGATSYLGGQVSFRNIGLYAQGTLTLSDQFSVDGGIRYTWDKAWGFGRTASASYRGPTAWDVPSWACVDGMAYISSPKDCESHYSKTSSAPTWTVGLNFKPVNDVLLFAKYSRGYRQGSVSPLAATGFKTYDPERVDTYEAGLKASLNGSIPATFNIVGFHNEFRDMQLQVAFLDLQPNTANGLPLLTPNPSIVNAGRARISGFEIDTTVQPAKGLSFQAGFSYINAKLTQFVFGGFPNAPNAGYDTLATSPSEGGRLPYTPKFRLTIGANYTLPLDQAVGKVTLGAMLIRTGSIFYTVDRTEALYKGGDGSIFAPGDKRAPFSLSPAYNLVNFNLDWANVGGGPVSLAAFVTNAFGKVYFDARAPGTRGFVQRYYGDPRMYGMRLRYDF